MKRITASTIAVLVLAVAAPSSAALPKLVGTVNPNFTITLKKNGVRVTKLKAGRYVFVIRDRGNIHNFVLRGPGLNRTLTGIAFVGTKTVTLRLRPGRYTYFCQPHETEMRGTFRVVS